MMLTPCCPKAGPTGGAGFAWPAGICNLMSVRTFLATFLLRLLYLLDLFEAQFGGSITSEDGYHHLELVLLYVNLRDLTCEVRQRTADHSDLFSHGKLSLGSWFLRGGSVKDTIHLRRAQGRGFVVRTNEAGDSRGVLHQGPRLISENHLDQYIPGKDALLLVHLLSALGLCLSLIHISEPTRRTPISYAV